jgi:hypothetical protein
VEPSFDIGTSNSTDLRNQSTASIVEQAARLFLIPVEVPA